MKACSILLLVLLAGCSSSPTSPASPAEFVVDVVGEYRGQTVFKSAVGGKEVVVILEKSVDAPKVTKYEYRLLATKRTSTLQKELAEAVKARFLNHRTHAGPATAGPSMRRA